jgi:hypothetical protein
MTNFEQIQWDSGETCEGCGSPITLVAEGVGVQVECDCGRAVAA